MQKNILKYITFKYPQIFFKSKFSNFLYIYIQLILCRLLTLNSYCIKKHIKCWHQCTFIINEGKQALSECFTFSSRKRLILP